MIACKFCNKRFTNISNQHRHEKACSKSVIFHCKTCTYSTRDSSNIRRHELVCKRRKTSDISTQHDKPCTSTSTSHDQPCSSKMTKPIKKKSFRHKCPQCSKQYDSYWRLQNHLNTHNMSDIELVNDSGTVRLVESALDHLARVYDVTPSRVVGDLRNFMLNMHNLIGEVINDLTESYQVKARFVAQIRYIRSDDSDDFFLAHFTSHASEYIFDFETWFNNHLNKLLSHLATFANRGSNWVLDQIKNVEINMVLLPNLTGSGSSFRLPAKLEKARAVINVSNGDDKCFLYAVSTILHFEEAKSNYFKVSDYQQWLDEYDLSGISFPMTVKDIPRFERLNDIKVNVHVYDNELKGVRYSNNRFVGKKTVNLLLVFQNDVGHYCAITNLSRLYYHKFKCHHVFICERCTQKFYIKDNLQRHYEFCSKGKAQIEVLPRNPLMKINKRIKQELSPPVVMYADIECIIKDGQHIPAAMACYLVWHSDTKLKPEYHTWVGHDCISNFLKFLDVLAHDMHNKLLSKSKLSLKMTEEDNISFKEAKTCAKCNLIFSKDKKKVRDHNHFNGQYRQALCSSCNIQLQIQRYTLPIIFHNFKNYDCHMITYKALGKMNDWKLKIVAATSDKYLTMQAQVDVGKSLVSNKTLHYNLKFIDSYQFLSASLSDLTKSLETFNHVNSLKVEYPTLSDMILNHKGIFPYTYFDDLNRLSEAQLPPIDAFYNDLNKQPCTASDYDHAQRAWKEFDCKTFADYMLAYLKLDILLLCDIFETFRNLTLSEDQIDPVHFISLPHLSFTTALNMNKDDLPHYLTDAAMYNFFERGIRGGMTFTNIHRARARIPELNNNQNGCRHLAYIDANNLYGSSLSKPLPHSNFVWLTADELEYFQNEENITNLQTDADTGYTFEVDLHIPKTIHDKTSDLPLAPESKFVEQEMFSSHMQDLYSELRAHSNFLPIKKLLLHHFDKDNYVVHFDVLKYYIKLGAQVKKVHAGVKYTQKKWLKEYIDFNSMKRKNSKNDFEKAYYKLRNNAIYGKSMENVRKRRDFRLINNLDSLIRLSSNPLYVQHKIIDESLVALELYKSKVTLNKLLYVGQTVLDYSKLEMYELYYETFQKCPLINKTRLCGGDTDSFFLCLYTSPDISLQDIFQYLQNKLDSSNYSSSHPLFSNDNRAKLGCFKDECAGRLLEEFILLKPKMYSMKYIDSHNAIKRAKGIQKSVVSSFTHENYRKIYYDKCESVEV